MLIFLKSGIQTTIQDLGRDGYRHLGINQNGAMDRIAIRLINILLGNKENEGVLEMHFPAPEMLFEKDTIIAIGGADFSPQLMNSEHQFQPLINWKPFLVKAGSLLKFTQKVTGARAYLAIKGGLAISQWMGSYSTNLAAKIGGRLIEKGDMLLFRNDVTNISPTDYSTFKTNISLSTSLIPHYFSNPIIRIIAGNEYQLLDIKSWQLLVSQKFTVKNDSNRMGFRLQAEPLQRQINEGNQSIEILSSAVNFGTIQLLPDGQLIILMADHQTMGGYPRIGHVISEDLSILAQLNSNDTFTFQLTNLETTENLLIWRESELKKLKCNTVFQNREM